MGLQRVGLHSYVYDIGGGLFTVGGNTETSTEGNWQANAYTRDDMYGTLYQKMLPVEIIRYTPPTAVMIIIDQSSSMMAHGQVYEQSKIYAAKQGASVSNCVTFPCCEYVEITLGIVTFFL